MIERASRLGDDVLAAEIRAFADSRQFGLVFEHNRPERMRLYGKPVSAGDVVQILPERGKQEDAASKLLWRVDDIPSGGGIANLVAYRSGGYSENDNEPCRERLENLVAVAEYDQPIYTGLRETGRVECGGDKPYQVVINGENYYALESLLFCYAGKVDCVYIDPPYNTGAKDWKYNNDYVDATDEYRHSKWLAMMERRLKLAKKLLNPKESVLICAIDEKEYLRLGLLLEQVFQSATIQMVSSVINPKGVAQKNGFRRADEYLFFVMVGKASPLSLQLSNEWSASSGKAASSKKNKVKLGWTSMMRRGSHSHRNERAGLYYPIYANPVTHSIAEVGEVIPESEHAGEDKEGLVQILPIRTDGSEGCWQVEPSELRLRIEQGRVRLGSKTSYGYVVNYLPDGEYSKVVNGFFTVIGRAADGSLITEAKNDKNLSVAPTQWKIASHNATEYGTGMISTLINRDFSFPKSLYAVEDSLRFFLDNKPSALVLDFFAGSGTTAHAVMRLNHQDGGRRRCICVTNNEVSDEEEKSLTKQCYRHGDPEWERLGICEYVTKPRIDAAITGRTPEGEPVKGDYKFTDEFPMADGFEENAVFFDLTYQNLDAVELGAAFEEIALLLWLRAGASGQMIEHEEVGFAVADTYAVLFDYSYVREFVSAVRSTPELACVFIVTDDAGRFASVKEELGDIECVRLYESYLRSFKIAAEDAVR